VASVGKVYLVALVAALWQMQPQQTAERQLRQQQVAWVVKVVVVPFYLAQVD
jgi:hypothetical protein